MLPGRAGRRPAWPALAGAAVGALLLAAAPLGPVAGATALASAELGGAAAAVVLHRRRLLTSRMGGGLVALLALLGTSSALLVLVGPGNRATLVLIVVAQLVGMTVLVPVVARARRPAGTSWHGSGLGGVGAELAIVGVGVGVVLLQTTVAAHRVGAGVTAQVSAGCDVVALAVVGWLFLTRTGASASARLALVGCGLFVVQNHLAVTTGVVLGSADDRGQVLGVAAALVVSAAALHPSLTDVGDPRRTPVLRSGATRALVVLPFSLLPGLAWVVGTLDPHSRLPVPVLVGAVVLITVLALVRALGLVAESERQADTDVLTGRLGRRGVLRRLDGLHTAHRPTWVALVDLDDFTEVNQRHGQEVGDALLRAVMGRLVGSLPPSSVVGRLGGDELLALVPARRPSTGESVAAAVAAIFADPFDVGGVPLRVAASTGTAGLHEAEGPREALAHADLAMRAAKARGGGQWLRHGPQLAEEVLRPLLLQRQLRALLEGGPEAERVGSADGVGRLVVQYQPVVVLATGAPLSVEALVRWEHPEHGTVPPGVFLPLAEAAGVGAALDREVLRQTLHQLASWDAMGLGVARAGVNLGRDSMCEPGLLAEVLAACAEAGLGPDRLVLEITEHDELASDAGVVADLLALREAGTSVALDDFGAGHASVGYLRRWPANIVKLDRSLLPSVAPAQPHQAMLDPGDLIVAVGSLVTAVGRHLLVEGIEDEADLAVALEAGAEYGQGYHFARPLDPDRLAAWWREATGVAVPSPGAVPTG